MDEQQLQAKIEEARAAGYTDSEIQAHLSDMAGAAPAIEAPEQNKHHEANVGAAQLGALAGAEQIGELGKKALEYGIPAYGLYKGGQAIANRIPGPVAPTGVAGPAVPNTSGFDAGGQKVADFAQQRGQFAPEASAAPSPQAQAYQAQQAARAAAQSPTAPPTAQNFIQRIAALGSQYAPAVRGLGGIAAAVMPGNVGQNYPFPQSGPLRGSEINPQTGRPWTPMELSRYNQQ
jgi:hypothetical protein